MVGVKEISVDFLEERVEILGGEFELDVSRLVKEVRDRGFTPRSLKKVDGTGDVAIEVNDGIAELSARKGESLGIEELDEAVGKAGFTPRGITITVVGHLEEMAGYPALHVPVGDITLVLEKNKQFDLLKKAVGDKPKEIKIRGKIYKDNMDGHTGHPYNLTIETYEIIGSS